MSEDPLSDLPQPQLRNRRRSDSWLIWLLPAIAVVAGLILVVRSYQSAGPTITISFKTAEGLDENTTTVKFKNVVIGKVKSIRLSEDRENVLVEVNLGKDAEGFAVTDTRFWVERPRVDLSGISGLNTLVSGAYIGMDVGTSVEPQRHFIGLESPPPVTHGQLGLRLLLSTDNLGSVNIGSPIYFHQLQVGRVVGLELEPDGSQVKLQAFIESPYDHHVNANTRFWNVSGVSVSLDANGLQVNAQSLLSLIAGGIAFETLPGTSSDQPPNNNRYRLYPSRAVALALPEGPSTLVRMRFFQSVRGLATGAPVEFTGMEIGTVKSVTLDFDRERRQVFADVVADIYPQRLGPVYRKLRDGNGDAARPADSALVRLLEHGLRAQLRSGNLITGQLFVALELPPKNGKAVTNLKARPLEIPTVPGGVDQLLARIGDLVEKLNAVPLEDIGSSLSNTLRSADSLVHQLDTQLAPEARRTLSEVREAVNLLKDNLDAQDGALSQDTQGTLDEVRRAARSLRNLSDYLQRHPDALLRGKLESEEPAAAEPAPEQKP